MNDDEQGEFDDVCDFQLLGQNYQPSGDSLRHSKRCPDLGRWYFSKHTVHGISPLKLGHFPSNPALSRLDLRTMTWKDDERGREDFVGHVLRQVRKDAINILRLNRLPEFFSKLAFSGHV